MANLTFKLGVDGNLPAATKKEGSVYVTTDKHEMWIDLSEDERIKIIDSSEMKLLDKNSYLGMASSDEKDDFWIRTTSLGLLPHTSGKVKSGHSSLGTDSWYFSKAYVDNIYSDTINLSSTTTDKMLYNSANPKIIFSENNTQQVSLIYTDHDSYRAPAGLKVVGASAGAWFEVDGSIYSGNWIRANVNSSGTDGGISLYGTSPDYGIMTRSTSNLGKHGSVTSSWATYFTMSNTDNRGWIFRRWGSKNVASIDTNGNATFDGEIHSGKDIKLRLADNNRFIHFIYNDFNASNQIGASWRIGAMGSGSGNTNYFCIQSGTSSTSSTTWTNVLRIGQNDYDIFVPGKVNIGIESKFKFAVAGDIYAKGGWVRTHGDQGWLSETYGGGWHMIDAGWIRSYGNKDVYINQLLRVDTALQVGEKGKHFKADNDGNGYFRNALGIAGNDLNYNLYVNGTTNLNGNTIIKKLDVSDEITGNLHSTFKIQKTNFTVTTAWQDVGIKFSNGTSELSSGTYILSIYSADGGSTGLYTTTWSGIMSWYGGSTNDSSEDEIQLHYSGHARNNTTLYLRTTTGKSSHAKLEICADRNLPAGVYTFKFVRLLETGI